MICICFLMLIIHALLLAYHELLLWILLSLLLAYVCLGFVLRGVVFCFLFFNSPVHRIAELALSFFHSFSQCLFFLFFFAWPWVCLGEISGEYYFGY